MSSTFLPFQLSKEFFHTLTQEHSSSFANAHYDCLMCAGVSARPQAQGSDLARFHPVRRNGVIEMRDDGKIMRNEAERQASSKARQSFCMPMASEDDNPEILVTRWLSLKNRPCFHV